MSVLGPFEKDTIVLGDSRDTMAKLPANCIDFAVATSPSIESTYAAHLDTLRAWVKGLFRVLKAGRRVAWKTASVAGQNYSDGLLPLPYDTVRIAVEEGFLLREEIFLHNPAAQDRWPTGSYPFGPSVLMRRAVKHILVLQKPAPKSPPQYPQLAPELKAYNIMDQHFFRDHISKQIWLEPSDDEALITHLIRMWTRPGETVYDPFMGRGATALAALTWKRHWFGSEHSPEHKVLAERLIEERLFQLSNEQSELVAL